MQKLDGSCIMPIKLEDGYVLGTRAGVTDVSELAQKFISSHFLGSMYDALITWCLNLNMTPLFEYCSRDNHIVIDYPISKLVLTGIQYMDTGKYMSYEELVRNADKYSIPVVDCYKSTSKSDFNNLVSVISALKNDEGVVVRFESGDNTGHMIKIKSADYIAKHRAIEKLKWEHDVIQLILNNQIDDILPILDNNLANKVKNYSFVLLSKITQKILDILAEYEVIKNIESQKEFAIKVNSSRNKSFLFWMRQGNEPLRMIIDHCKKYATGQTGVKEIKQFINMELEY